MRVFSTKATTPSGNEYQISRYGRIGLGSTAAIYGLAQAKKSMSSDEFTKKLAKSAREASKKHAKCYNGIRKVAFAGFAGAICALAGFIAGGAVDFVVNRISKNKADNKQKA